MEFDKAKVFTALNADELRAGDKVIVADDLATLKCCVKANDGVDTLYKVEDESGQYRFGIISDGCEITFNLAYLVERKEQKAEKHYRPFRDTDELIAHWLEIGGKWQKRELTMPFIWVRDKSDRKVWLIHDFDKRILDYLFTNCEFLDGSPCGVEVVE